MNYKYTESKSNSKIEFIGLAFKDYYAYLRKSIIDFFSNFTVKMSNTFSKMKASPSFQVAFYAFIVSVLSYGYVLITQHFTLPINGDFMLQGMTFIYNGYDDWHYFFQTGHFVEWDTSGLIGVSNINAYSFYYLFDPFFLALLIFPRSFLLQAQAIMMILKLVLAAVFFFKYLSCFDISKSTRKIGAISYAFCGWGWFYLWFFHFQEVLTFFPLMLLGIEYIFRKKDLRLFVLSCFLMGCTNFQFLAISLMCTFIYAMCRWFKDLLKNKFKGSLEIILIGFIAFLLGILTCAFILLPNYISIQNMPRVSSSTYLLDLKNAEGLKAKFDLIFSWGDEYSYKHLYPLAASLFMSTSSFATTLFSLNGYDNVGINMYIYAPLILMIVPSLLDAIKQKKFSQIIFFVFGVIALETPFVYYLSGLFANAYARWVFFPISMMVLLVCLHFDNLRRMPKWYLLLSLITVMCLFIYVVIKVKDVSNKLPSNIKPFDSYYNILIYIQGAYYFVIFLFLTFRCKSKTFKKESLYIVCLEAIVMGNLAMQTQGYTSYSSSLFGGHQNTVQQTKIISELNKYDSSLFRIMNSQMTRSQPNLAMVEGYNGVGLFCSVYNYDSEEFFNWSRVSYGGGWTLGIHEKRMNLDEFLGIKYYLVRKDDNNVPFLNKMFTDVTENQDCPSSLKAAINNSEFKLYQNQYFVDLAFSYDTFLPSSRTLGNEEDNTKLSSLINKWGFYNSDYFYSGVEATNNNEINYLKHAVIDSSYLVKHSDEFDKLMEDKEIDVGHKGSMEQVNSYNVSYYYTNWDPSSEGGNMRTISPSYSDSYINNQIKLYLSGNKNALEGLENLYNKNNGPLNYPQYSIIDYVNYLQNKENIDEKYEKWINGDNNAITEEEKNQYRSKYEYNATSLENGKITDNTVFSGRKSYLGIYPADTYQFNGNELQTNGTNLSFNSKIVLTNSDLKKPVIAKDSNNENPYFVSINSKFGYNIDFALYGYDLNYDTATDKIKYDDSNKESNYFLDTETNSWPTYGYKLETHDQHMQNNYSKSGDWKYARGFYTSSPIYAIVGTLKDTLGNKNNSSQNTNETIRVNSLQQESWNDLKKDLDKQKENEVEMTYKDANNFNYTSNYSKTKLVVLNVPYDIGFKLKRTYEDQNGNLKTEDVNYFKAQGGFIGYIANKGKTNYELSYSTPKYYEGKIITGISISTYLGLCYLYLAFDSVNRWNRKYISITKFK